MQNFKFIILFFFTSLWSNFTFSQADYTHINDSVPAAKQILAEALAQAKKENKNVFVIFRSSQCPWCRRMEKIINSEPYWKLFQKHYVIASVTIWEENKSLENKGGEELFRKYTDSSSGVPFYVVLDGDRIVLGNSLKKVDGTAPDKPGKNIGCPVSNEEIDYFISLLKKTSLMNANDLQIIANGFLELGKQRQLR